MNLIEQLTNALATGASLHHGGQTLDFEDAGQRLICQLTALDSLACALLELEFQSDRLRGASTARLEGIAAALSKKLSYLLEPIQPIETDADRCVVQMRSSPPHKHAAGTDYYELLVTAAGSIHLARYSRAPGASRTPIAAQLTHEVLIRLASDFAAAVVGS
ncbi:MAG TPA: hypothetical protein VMF30_00390 [Pirellulales bacterium]|nr:hypothetical protein [Pirellulales bacterium]